MSLVNRLLVLGLIGAQSACVQSQPASSQTAQSQPAQAQPVQTQSEQSEATDCLEVVLTGTQGGPPAVNGLAGPGTLVRYGTTANQCNDVVLQFDAGRGTTERLSQLKLTPNKLDAIFLTHLHSDHTEGLIGLMQLRWHFFGGPLDVICSADAPAAEHTLSCAGFLSSIGEPFLQAGEIAQRHAENKKRDPKGPAALVRHNSVPLNLTSAQQVWSSDDVVVSAISTTHIPGSLAYRVDTPAGSVVIGGDAGNSNRRPPRETSTSDRVEALAKDADILVHSAIHPIFGPGGGSKFPPPIYFRQSDTRDLGLLAQRAGVEHLVLTHLIPALNAPRHGPFEVPGGALTSENFEEAAKDSGFEGQIHVGEDLSRIRLEKTTTQSDNI